MHIIYIKPHGVCARAMSVAIDDRGRVHTVSIRGGCPGMTVALATMLNGIDARDVVRKLTGIKCGKKDTSCADQLARGLKAAIDD